LSAVVHGQMAFPLNHQTHLLTEETGK
jgi:hypothetical protein